jgi:hypothetical protein
MLLDLWTHGQSAVGLGKFKKSDELIGTQTQKLPA